MADRRLDLSILLGIAAGLAAGVGLAAELLKGYVNAEPAPTVWMLTLTLAVLLLTGVAAAIMLSLIMRLIALSGGFSEGFWPVSAIILQDFALWLTIWTVLWGAPFIVALALGAYLNQFLNQFIAGAIAVGVGVAVVLFLKRFASTDIWHVLGGSWPARYVGSFWMVVGVIIFMAPGKLLLDRCYVFDVTGIQGSHRVGELVPVEVRLSGRILNHSGLRLEIISKSATRPTRRMGFQTEEPGVYESWCSLGGLPPGEYDARIYIDNSKLTGTHASFAKAPIFRTPERHVLFHITL